MAILSLPFPKKSVVTPFVFAKVVLGVDHILRNTHFVEVLIKPHNNCILWKYYWRMETHILHSIFKYQISIFEDIDCQIFKY